MNHLSELKHVILREIMNNPKITNEGLSSKTGSTSRHIQRWLGTLKSRGYVRRNGSNKTIYWEVLK